MSDELGRVDPAYGIRKGKLLKDISLKALGSYLF